MMGWYPKRPGRERILLYGMAGTGKSTAALSIAARIDGTVHIIDTDYALDAMLFGDDVPENIEPHPVDLDDWDGFVKEFVDLLKTVHKDDWIVIDSMSPTWDAVQEAFVNKIHGKDIEDFFLAARKAMGTAKNLQPLEGWKDYTVINKMYQKVYNLIYKAPCHVLLTAEATSVSNDTDSREIRDMFGRIGQRPKGQKRLPFVPHTVLHLKKSGRDSYVYTTVKDRQREDQVDAELSDFAKDYLWAVAGWRPRRAS